MMIVLVMVVFIFTGCSGKEADGFNLSKEGQRMKKDYEAIIEITLAGKYEKAYQEIEELQSLGSYTLDATTDDADYANSIRAARNQIIYLGNAKKNYDRFIPNSNQIAATYLETIVTELDKTIEEDCDQRLVDHAKELKEHYQKEFETYLPHDKELLGEESNTAAFSTSSMINETTESTDLSNAFDETEAMNLLLKKFDLSADEYNCFVKGGKKEDETGSYYLIDLSSKKADDTNMGLYKVYEDGYVESSE